MPIFKMIPAMAIMSLLAKALAGAVMFLTVGWLFPETLAAGLEWAELDVEPWQAGLLTGLAGGALAPGVSIKTTSEDD